MRTVSVLVGWTRRLHALRGRARLWRCQRVGRDVWVRGIVRVHGGGRVTVGARARMDARTAPIEIHALPGAEIIIGDDVSIRGGASIEARARVVIGDRAHLDGFCKIVDNHFHPVRGDRHARPESQPVVLEPDVVLGWRAVVLPGVTVGRGTFIHAGTVVRRSPGAPKEA
ncbi:MAG: acetyltransferase [Deltaproteobacteria bacterium]|nr:acetyltransferase [Deltaproteobacteria bacterium]